MVRWLVGITLCSSVLGASTVARAQAPAPTPDAQQSESTVPETPPAAQEKSRTQWLDATHQQLYDFLWHSAMRVDRWFGSDKEEAAYQTVYGSLAPAVLWDQHYHYRVPVRFNVTLPLPQLNSRLAAFVGRVNPNEYVTESEEPSGAFRRQYGPLTEDQTLFGLAYHEPPKQGGYFDAGAGLRVSLPFDPYIKGSYVYERGASNRGLLTLRETAFWEQRDGFGVTTRADTERIYDLRWLVRWSWSATFAQKTKGVRGWSSVVGMRGFPARRAIAMEIGFDGESNAPVPLHDYGMKVAYRQGVLRRWLILEVRTSVDWPKDYPAQWRRRSLGIGVGFEMLFGTQEFLARPVTF